VPETLPPSFARTSLSLLADQTHVNLLGNVHVGDIARTVGQVNWAGRTSMEIGRRTSSSSRSTRTAGRGASRACVPRPRPSCAASARRRSGSPSARRSSRAGGRPACR